MNRAGYRSCIDLVRVEFKRFFLFLFVRKKCSCVRHCRRLLCITFGSKLDYELGTTTG